MATSTTRYALSKPASADVVSTFQSTIGTSLGTVDTNIIGLQGAYAGGTTYYLGDVVTSAGFYYMSTTTQSAAAPPGATWAQLGPVPTFYVASTLTAGTTSSSSYTNNLTTSGATPSVSATVTARGILLITLSTNVNMVGTSTTSTCTFALSGANTLSAADSNGGGPFVVQGTGTESFIFGPSKIWLLTGLTAGATTVQLYWKNSAGTISIGNQLLIVEAY